MKAAVWTEYGSPDSLQIRDVEKPAPKENELLIKIHATTVTAGDTEIRRMKIPVLFRLPMRMYVGLIRPKRMNILGMELAGVIESVGKDVTRFKTGDQVFAAVGFPLGAHAEYICLPEDGLVAPKPANLSNEEAAAVPNGARDALTYLRAGKLRNGQKVLIYGASGSIGTFAVQLAKHFGAEVTGVCSTRNLEMVKSLGADKVIDYTREDFTESGETYDVILDTVGKSPYSRSIRSLKEHGFFVTANPGLRHMIRGPWTSMTSTKTVVTMASSEDIEDLIFLKGLIEAGELRPVIDRRYPLEEIAEAHRYVDTGRKRGNVVIVVAHDSES